MKKTLLFFAFGIAALISGNSVQAQMADGSIAPDWTMTDYAGTSHTLYSYLDNNQPTFLDFFATWCGPCWSYAQTGAMEDAFNQYGPSGTAELQIFSIEGDGSTNTADLEGTGSNTTGNWTTALINPLIDDDSQTQAYEIAYWPTIYMVCPNRQIFEVGQLSSAAAFQQAAATCPPPASQANDIAVLSYAGDASSDCDGLVNISAVVQNYGTSAMTSATIEVTDASGNVLSTTPWTGSLNTYDIETVSLGTATVAASGETITITVTTADDDASNNVITQTIGGVAEAATLDCELVIVPDNYGSETTWELKDSQNATVASGGPYVDGTTTPELSSFTLVDGECYSFIINDAYGDGICCSYGMGSYTITDSNGNTVFTGGEFTDTESKNFKVNVNTSVQAISEKGISMFPNPTAGILNIQAEENVEVVIVDVLGNTVVSEVFNNNIAVINLDAFEAGVYSVTVTTENSSISERIILTK